MVAAVVGGEGRRRLLHVSDYLEERWEGGVLMEGRRQYKGECGSSGKRKGRLIE